jgi:transposase-like protein
MALFVSSHRCRWFNLLIFGYVKNGTQAAYAFLKRLVKQFDEPKVVVTDKAPLLQVPLRN